MRKSWKIAAVLTPLFALTLVACPDEDAPPPPEDRPAADEPAERVDAPARDVPDVDLPEGVMAEMVAMGGDVYHGAGICFTCHGQEGVGGALGPALNDRDWLNIQEGTYDELVQVITNGVAQPVQYPAPMPPRGGANISEEQIRQVAAYVYALSYSN